MATFHRTTGIRLTDTEIRTRFTRLRNLERLHAHDRKQITALKAKVRQLEQEKAADRVYFKVLIQKQAIQIAELQAMVFGKKKRPLSGTLAPEVPNAILPQPRSAASYRRPIPSDEDVTATVTMPLPDNCPHCGSEAGFAHLLTHERYVEDVALPELTPGYRAKLVTKYVVRQGRCTACSRKAAGYDLSGAVVSLGPNVRLLAADLTARLGLSYSQVASLLDGLYGLHVTDGELANLLQKQHEVWLPAYGRLKTSIRAAPVVHLDETPWHIQDNDCSGYAWCLADAASGSVCYTLANSRGASHAKQLLGQDTEQPFTGVRISDDYGAYRNPELPGQQQLCWVHLYRTIRDLTYNDNLPQEQRSYVAAWYTGFAGIYAELRQALAQPYDRKVRMTQASELWLQLSHLASQPAPAAGEPQKLSRLKAQLLRAGQSRLFACLPADTPCDNNRAERDLRQLVLKRKRSFGSKTQKGANALATILSVCTTTWRRQATTSGGYYLALAGV